MKDDSRFWNKTARRYARKPVPDAAIYEEKLRITQSYLSPHMRVLEIGCGTGTTALRHASYAAQIDAVDFSREMIDIAQSKAREQNNHNVNFICSRTEDLDYAPGSFDMVMAHSILHLLKDKDAMLRQIYTWLKPGGFLVSSTACVNEILFLFKYVLPLGYRLNLIPHVTCFGYQDLLDSHRQAGFQIEREWRASRGTLFLVAKKPSAGS